MRLISSQFRTAATGAIAIFALCSCNETTTTSSVAAAEAGPGPKVTEDALLGGPLQDAARDQIGRTTPPPGVDPVYEPDFPATQPGEF